MGRRIAASTRLQPCQIFGESTFSREPTSVYYARVRCSCTRSRCRSVHSTLCVRLAISREPRRHWCAIGSMWPILARGARPHLDASVLRVFTRSLAGAEVTLSLLYCVAALMPTPRVDMYPSNDSYVLLSLRSWPELFEQLPSLCCPRPSVFLIAIADTHLARTGFHNLARSTPERVRICVHWTSQLHRRSYCTNLLQLPYLL